MTAAVTVSVVIPTHNCVQWIGETLASVLAQHYPQESLQVIVVDDGSTDDTFAIAARVLAAAAIDHLIFRNATPQGPSAARNRGWREARGAWIQFLDADDLLHPSKVERQATVAAQSDPSVAVVYSPWARLACEHGTWTPAGVSPEPSFDADAPLELLRADRFMATGSQLFRRRWLEQVGGYRTEHRLVEDVDLLLRLAFAGARFSAAPAPEALFFYRTRASSLSHANANENEFVDGCLRNAALAERHWRERDELTPARAAGVAAVYFQGARHYAARNPELFRTITQRIDALGPGLLPDGPPALRALSRVVGYPLAERCATGYRRMRHRAR